MCSSRCETDGPATGFMLTDMPCADAVTAAPGPAGRDVTPGTAGDMPLASSPGGTGGPMKAGFAAPGAAWLVEAATGAGGTLVPGALVAKPGTGALSGVSGAGPTAGRAGMVFSGAPGFTGIVTGPVTAGAGAPTAGLAMSAGDGLPRGARATTAGAPAGAGVRGAAG